MTTLITDFCFLPSYQDTYTGETLLPLCTDGTISSIHTLHGLPDNWMLARNERGLPLALKAHIVAGFMRSGRLYTPEELANIPFDG
jgi:hypothetical protein